MREAVKQHVVDTAMQSAVSKAPYLGATVTIIGGYTLSEWLAIVGIIFTILSFCLNWYMQAQRLKIMREEVSKRRERWTNSDVGIKGDK